MGQKPSICNADGQISAVHGEAAWQPPSRKEAGIAKSAGPTQVEEACIESQRHYTVLGGWQSPFPAFDPPTFAEESTGDAVEGLGDSEFVLPRCACGKSHGAARARGTGLCECDQWRWAGNWHIDKSWQPRIKQAPGTPPEVSPEGASQQGAREQLQEGGGDNECCRPSAPPRPPKSPQSIATTSCSIMQAPESEQGWRYGGAFDRIRRPRAAGRCLSQPHDVTRQRRWVRRRENVTKLSQRHFMEPPSNEHAAAVAGAPLLRMASCEVECVVCFDAARETVFVHDGSAHQACCARCAAEVFRVPKSDGCPMCRRPIERIVAAPPLRPVWLTRSQRCIVCCSAPQNALLVHGDDGCCCTCLACARRIAAGEHQGRCPGCHRRVDAALQLFNDMERT